MALPQGIDFRGSSGYVTDPANCTYQIVTSANYPTTTPQGNNVGIESGWGSSAQDRSAAVDPRLAGSHAGNTAGATFRIDLPAGGAYNVRFAAGRAGGYGDACAWDLYDSTTKLTSLTTGSTSTGYRWKDAKNVEYSDTAWPTSNSPYAATFATTILRIKSTNSASISHLYVESNGSAPIDTPVNPGVGTIALTGYAPTLAQTANQAIAPGVGSIAITGYAPTVVQHNGMALVPGVGTIAITGYAPTIAQPIAVAPGVGSLAITGYAPTTARTANKAVVPGVGSLALTGYAPSVAQSAAGNVQPGAGSIALTGYAPMVSRSSALALTPGVGSVALTGYAPSIAQTANQSLAPGAGSVALTGYAPMVTQAGASQILIPGMGMLAITGYPPLVAQSGAIEFGSPMISTPQPRNWTSTAQPRNWIARRDF